MRWSSRIKWAGFWSFCSSLGFTTEPRSTMTDVGTLQNLENAVEMLDLGSLGLVGG